MKTSTLTNYLPRVALLLFFSALTAAGSYRILTEVTQSERWVADTNKVIESLNELLSEIKDAETGARGFLLAGKEEYLEPYKSALNSLPQTIITCRQVVNDNPRQLERFKRVESDIDLKLVLLKKGIQSRRALGFFDPNPSLVPGEGKRVMDRIRLTIGTMESDERRLLQGRLENRTLRLRVVAGFMSFLVAFLLASFISLLSEIRSRQKTQEKLALAFDQLQSSEERFRLLIEGVKDYALYWLDAEGRISTWTPTAERIKGYKAEEIVGSHFSRFYSPEDIAAHKPEQILKTAMADGYAELEGWQIKKDGSQFFARALVGAVKDPRGRLLGFSKLVQDITAQKQTEEALDQKEQELAQSRKLEAVGRLAGGVAHDFNNLMTGIIGICDDLAEDPSLQKRKEDIQVVLQAATRATQLTKQLLAFSRRQVATPVVLNMNVLISDMQKMLKRIIGEDIEFSTFLDPQIGNVRIDPGQIEQIIINLAINSKDAMPQGGQITIETVNVDLTEEYVKRHFEVKPGSYVGLIFSDTGSGIAEEIQSHIFEPFFTTKEKGKGTGLGLATVYGIIKQNGGDIFLYSHPGKGTTFKIYLPRVSEEATAKQLPKNPNTTIPTGTETILLVEDEDIVRRVAARALTKQGYNVLEAHHGNQALEIATKFEGSIDLLLTDVVMPGMNGRQLAEQLATSRTDLKILYMSGYTENIIVNRGILKAGISFIEKSFTSASLCRKVRDILDAPKKSFVS
jgi:PAS domain S-box-containing protein